MPFIGNKPSAVPLTSADITDNVITSAKIVDGTITNTDIASSIITGQTAETSIAGGDQILIYDDSATALRKMTRTNFVAGIGNTPAFHAYNNADQNISASTETQVVFNTEIVDTHNAFASNQFTVPSGEGGKYYIYFQLTYATSADFSFQHTLQINSDFNADSGFRANGFNWYYDTSHFARIINLSAGDVIKVMTYQSAGTYAISATENRPVFGGFKLIGV